MTPGKIILIFGLIIHIVLGIVVMYSQDEIIILTWVTTIGLATIIIVGIEMRYYEKNKFRKNEEREQ